MEKVLKLYKNLGETPLECLERFRSDNHEYADEKMTYAGRLDPMAEGLLIALVGEECKKKDDYLGLDKEYIFEVLFGFQSDTYDILGVTQKANSKILKNFRITDLVGKRTQEYPAYSSKTIDGKPMFQMARDGEEFDAPTREVEIFDIEMLEEREITKEKLLAEILERIDLVHGDFRQEEIKSAWNKILENASEKFQIKKFKINCSSGTYVRSICNDLGGLAYLILRTRVGEYKI